MIAFASVFLMKVTTKRSMIIGLNVEPSYVLELLERVIALLKGSITGDRHLLHHIAAGLEKMLAKAQAVGDVSDSFSAASNGNQMPQMSAPGFDGTTLNQGQSAMTSGLNSGFNNAQDLWPQAQFQDHVNQGGFEDMTIMNDFWIDEAFGTESTNAVYNLLTNQFSY